MLGSAKVKKKWLTCLFCPWTIFEIMRIYPGVVNRTKPNQKPIEPNRIQSFDWSSIGSTIEHNRIGTFSVSYHTPSRTQFDAICSILSGRKTKWYTKNDKHSLSVELEGFHSLIEF